MKFQFNFKYFISGILLILVINYSLFIPKTKLDEDSITTGKTTLIATFGDIQNSIEVVGNAELVDEQSLSFNKAGTIVKVNFEAGDEVKKGEIIAQIDDSDAYNSIDEAKISLENAQINLNQLYESVDESKIIKAKNDIITAENKLENSQKELTNLEISQENSLNKLLDNISTSKKELDSLKSAFVLSKKELITLKEEKDNSFDNTNVNKDTTIVNIEESFRSNLILIENIIEKSDYIMGVTNENKEKNDEYEDYLGAKDKTIKSQAKSNLLETINMFEDLNYSLDNYNYNKKIETIEKLLQNYLDMFNKLYSTCDLIYKTLENSIVSVGSLNQSEIDSMKNSMSSYRSNTLDKVSQINNSINSLKTLTNTNILFDSNSNLLLSKEENIKNNELSIEKQELSIKNEEKNYSDTIASYELIIKTKKQDIENNKTSLELTNINLEELLEGPTDDNIAKANNSIKQAKIRLETAYENLEDYLLEAPFDGVISKIDYMVGDNLINDTSKYVYIENPNLLEISVMLDQIDIVTVELNQEAIVTFDTYPTIPVKAKVYSIDTTPVKSSGVVSYEVKLVLDDSSFDKKILSGMTADLEIITESVENVIIIKTSAIKEKNKINHVTVLENGKEVQKEVEVGISSNGMSEIISGLSKGDKIIIDEFVTSSTGENKSNSSSLFPGGGMGGGNRQGMGGGNR